MNNRTAWTVIPALALFLIFQVGNAPAYDDIATLWGQAKTPPAPELSRVAVSPSDTALLILDIEELTCNQERRPRCLETVPRIAAFLKKARAAGMPVVYSLTSRGTPETILPGVKPQGGEPIVKASVNKFYGTDLDAILKSKGVKRVIVCGTAAHGAVMHTATGAGQRGLEVILPVDGLSASDLYIEQAAVQLLKTGPGTRRGITLTRFDMIDIRE